MQLNEIETAAPMKAPSPQGMRHSADVRMVVMDTAANPPVLAASSQERRRTIYALLSASIISLVVWGLVVVLNVH